jgi:hypothetical protein
MRIQKPEKGGQGKLRLHAMRLLHRDDDAHHHQNSSGSRKSMILNPSVRIEPERRDSPGPRIVPAGVCLLAAHLDWSDTPAMPGMHAPLHHVAAAIFRVGIVVAVVVVRITVIVIVGVRVA